MDLNIKQKEIIQNKINKGFNTTNIEKEFCLLYGEVSEAYDAYQKKEDVASELADIAIYTLGIAEILNISLSDEIEKKMEINKNRVYIKENGVYTKIEPERNKK